MPHPTLSGPARSARAHYDALVRSALTKETTMPDHPDFTLHVPAFSSQALELRNEHSDVVRLVVDTVQDRTLLAGALETSLVLFEVLKKKGQ